MRKYINKSFRLGFGLRIWENFRMIYLICIFSSWATMEKLKQVIGIKMFSPNDDWYKLKICGCYSNTFFDQTPIFDWVCRVWWGSKNKYLKDPCLKRLDYVFKFYQLLHTKGVKHDDGTTMKQAIQWQSIHNLLLLRNVQKMSTTNHEVVWLSVTNFQTWRTKCGLLNWLACDHIALLVFTSNKMSPSVCLNYCDKACGHQNKMPGQIHLNRWTGHQEHTEIFWIILSPKKDWLHKQNVSLKVYNESDQTDSFFVTKAVASVQCTEPCIKVTVVYMSTYPYNCKESDLSYVILHCF